MPGIRHLQARIDGLIGTNQTWSINPKFAYTTSGIPTQTVMDGWATAIAALNAAKILPLDSLWGEQTFVTGTTCSYVGDDGISAVIAKRILATPAGGSVAGNLPGQCSVVVTLQSNIPGRSARGRLYLPLLAAPLDPDTIRLSPSVTQAIATQMGSWLQDVADAWPGPETLVPVVSSQTKGTNTPVTSTRVGDVIDTQRRRRDQMLENYSTGVVG